MNPLASLSVVDLELLAISLHDEQMSELFDVVHVLNLSVVLLRVLDVTREIVLDGVDERAVLTHHTYTYYWKDGYLAR